MSVSTVPTSRGGLTEGEEAALNEFLNNLSVVPINPPVIENVPKPDPHANYGATVRTNVFQIDVKEKKTVFKYQVKITGHRDNSNPDLRAVEFTNPAPSEFHVVDRRRVCTRLFNALVESNKDALGSRTQLYYDQRSTLFTLKKLTVKMLNMPREGNFPDIGEDLEIDSQLRGCVRFEFRITLSSVELSNELAESIVRQHFGDFENGTVQFLDVASLQEMASRPEEFVLFGNGAAYYISPQDHGENEPDQLPHGVYIAAGLQKHIHVTEGSSTKMSIVVSPKYSLFHTVQRLPEKLAGMGNVEEINALIKGTYILPEHLMTMAGQPRLCVARVVRLGLPADEETFELDGETITVADYYAQRYQLGLERPRDPVVVCKQGGKDVCYPQEVCIVADNIKVSTNASTSAYVAALIKRAAKLPVVLQRCVMNAFRALNLENSEFLNNAGLRVSNRPVDVRASSLVAPSILYRGGSPAQFEPADSMWKTRGTKYHLSAPLANSLRWVCYAAVRGDQITVDQLRTFGVAYLQMCQMKGLVISQPTDVNVLNLGGNPKSRDLKALEEALTTAVDNGCKFALVITNKIDVPVHAALKSYEQMFQIITQNVTKGVAFSAAGIAPNGGRIQGKPLTMENIVNKTNMKLGGLNYLLRGNNGELGRDDLFVGFGLNHVAGGLGMDDEKRDESKQVQGKPRREESESAPTVLGYAANDSKEPCAFIGSFVYGQSSRVGNLGSFNTALEIVFERYLGAHGKSPKRVFIYRNGCSEGELKHVVRFELPLYKKLVADKLGDEVKLVLVVTNKMHSVRITPTNPQGQRAKDQNVMPGTVVDTHIVHPSYGEFYLASTKALQGSTKVPRYIVLCNDPMLSLTEIEKITYDLCFAHQIISLPTSLPSPVYVAEEYAKRGRMLFNAAGYLRPGAVQDLDKLTENLSLDSTPDLRINRVNA